MATIATTTRPLRIFIVDDHNIIISGIRSLLDGVGDVQLIGEAHNGEEAVQTLSRMAPSEVPDLVLMDIKMPKMNGIEATRQLHQVHPDMRIMALTMFDDEEYVTTMISAGAHGYIMKNTGKEELLLAIRKVAGGENYFSAEATSAVMARFMQGARGGTTAAESGPSSDSDEATDNDLQLTKREIEILRLIASEMTNQEIADKLFISPRTVHSHRRNLMQKVGVKNTAGLVRYAIRHELID